MSCWSRRYFHERVVLWKASHDESLPRFYHGPSFGRSWHWRLRLLRKSCHPFTREEAPSTFHRMSRPFRRRLIGWPYRFALLPEGSRLHCRRSRTFTGQCCQPFCSGDATSHSDGPRVVTKCRHVRERIVSQGFIRLRSLAHHPSRNVTPPGLSSPGPSVADCYRSTLARRLNELRVKIFVPAWTRTVGFDSTCIPF